MKNLMEMLERAVFALLCMLFLGIVGQPAYAQNNVDNDGDGYAEDEDGDGVLGEVGEDCDDTSIVIHPNQDEQFCDGVDDDCDGVADDGMSDNRTWYVDADNDSYGVDAGSIQSCVSIQGRVNVSGDCDDNDPLRYPNLGIVEVAGSGIDANCDGSLPEEDRDGDGQTNLQGDCNDNPLAGGIDQYLDAVEDCNGIDDDCGGSVDFDEASGTDLVIEWCLDLDLDGDGDLQSCANACDRPEFAVNDNNDCNDNNILVGDDVSHVELCLNGLDDDCDGAIDSADSECP